MAKVLIVDDDLTVQELFKYIFSEAGHTVAVAANGREGLERLAETIPDFMIVDVTMPVMNGREFIREVTALGATDASYAGIPFIVMTGENFLSTDVNEGFASVPGFVCFFSKLTPLETVMQKMAETLAR
jgi:CheY-like chemotaxis protein